MPRSQSSCLFVEAPVPLHIQTAAQKDHVPLSPRCPIPLLTGTVALFPYFFFVPSFSVCPSFGMKLQESRPNESASQLYPLL